MRALYKYLFQIQYGTSATANKVYFIHDKKLRKIFRYSNWIPRYNKKTSQIFSIINLLADHMAFVNLDIPQAQPSNVMQAHHPHQQLSTQELIASVRARCNQTKEVKCI